MIINNIGGKISSMAPAPDSDQKKENSNQGSKYIPSFGQPNRHGNKTCYLQELGKLRRLHFQMFKSDYHFRGTNSRPEKEKVEGERKESRLVGTTEGSRHRIQSDIN